MNQFHIVGKIVNGKIGLAIGGWLKLLKVYHYNNERK